jgi:hypothetical protein
VAFGADYKAGWRGPSAAGPNRAGAVHGLPDWK